MTRLSLQDFRPFTRLPESQWTGGLLHSAHSMEQAETQYGHIVQWMQQIQPTAQFSEVFLQIWRLGISPAGSAYGTNIQRWLPIAGIGVVPGERPPQRMTEEIAMDVAAAGLAGEDPPLASHPVAHVSAGPEGAHHAAVRLFGSGIVLQMWFDVTTHSGWAIQTQEVFRSTITDPLFQRERFYAPLLTASLIEKAGDEELDRWLCGATAYLREDPGEKGTMLLWRSPSSF